MAEEEQEFDPAAEGRRIANLYLSELGWSQEYKRQTVRQLIPVTEKDVKLKHGDEMEITADEHFGEEVDVWRQKRTKTGRAVLLEIFRILGKRNDLSFFGKRIVHRLKEELEWT